MPRLATHLDCGKAASRAKKLFKCIPSLIAVPTEISALAFLLERLNDHRTELAGLRPYGAIGQAGAVRGTRHARYCRCPTSWCS